MDDELKRQIVNGTSPAYACLEHPPAENIVVDLNRMMTVDKNAVAVWSRSDGFTSDAKRQEFAGALERKLGRFAFPDEFGRVMSKWRGRVIRSHSSSGSLIGNIYRSLIEIRVIATPHWESQSKTICMVVVTKEPELMTAPIEDISTEFAAQIEKTTLPQGYAWSEPPFVMGTLDYLPARALYDSQLLDFNFLSGF